MPEQKDLKRIVRTRMQKTGESYTAARLQVVKSSPAARKPSTAATAPVEDTSNYAAIAGMSDQALKKATGSSWVEWVGMLDAEGAAKMPHPEIAKTTAKLGAGSWWSQIVSVGYERIRGLRQKGQSREGLFNVNASKTIQASGEEIHAALRTARERAKWLPGTKLTFKSATDRAVRLRWSDDAPIEFGIYQVSAGKFRVSVEHRKRASREDADLMKSFWKDALAALATYLSGK